MLLDSQKKLKSRLGEMINLKDLLIKRQDDLIDYGERISHLLQEQEKYLEKLVKIKKLTKTYQDTSVCEDFQKCIRDLKEILGDNT